MRILSLQRYRSWADATRWFTVALRAGDRALSGYLALRPTRRVSTQRRIGRAGRQHPLAVVTRPQVLARTIVVPLLVLAIIGGCGSTSDKAPRPISRVVLADAPPSAALAALPNGGLLVGPLGGGPIGLLRADRDLAALTASGFRAPPVQTGGQRGLLSLAVDDLSRVYASWISRGSERLIVGRLRRNAPPLIIWNGPRSQALANGGHLEVAPDGQLVIGLGAHAASGGIVGPYGQMLSLDPRAPADQEPFILSRGWINPFAFTYTGDDRLWIADNANREPERLAIGDAGEPADVTNLPRKTAPSGLAALPDGDLALCGFLTGTLDRYRREPSGRWQRVATIATRCRFGVVLLADGQLAYAEDRTIRVVHP